MEEKDRVTDNVRSSLGEKTARSQAVSTVCQSDKVLFSPPRRSKGIWGAFRRQRTFSSSSVLRLFCNIIRTFFKRRKRGSVIKTPRAMAMRMTTGGRQFYRPEVPRD